MLLLSTLPRLKAEIQQDSAVGAVGPNVDMQLSRILAGVSQQISEYCENPFLIQEWTERHAVAVGQRELFPDNPTVRSVMALRHDAQGFFANGYSTLAQGSDYSIDPEGRRIILLASWPGVSQDARIFELIYQGGTAHATATTVYKATATGTVPTGAQTLPDGRALYIRSYASGELTFLPQIGNFWPSDVLDLAGGIVVTLGEAVTESVVNDHPMLESACLMQASYEWERRRTLGRNSTTNVNGETTYRGEFKLLDAVREKLNRYRITHQRF